MTTSQKIKQKIWNVLYGIFPWVEKHLLFFHEKKRQRYHFGWLRPDKTLNDLKKHLSSKWLFGNHFVAWEDSSQILSWRKLASFDEQYHLRVYNDGEIRGHYEYTPESAPVKHFFEKGEISKQKDFEKFLEGYIVKDRYARVLENNLSSEESEGETVFSEK